MAQVTRSGAFLQQCWSVHPLCVGVKRITDPHTVVLVCTSCRSVHHLQCETVTAKQSLALVTSDAAGGERAAGSVAQLAACIEGHAAALSLREMDVFDDRALIRCAECRCHYELAVSQFETHHK
ncbi:MAG: hypothetical protein U0412_02230 [Nitrospira sp.]